MFKYEGQNGVHKHVMQEELSNMVRLLMLEPKDDKNINDAIERLQAAREALGPFDRLALLALRHAMVVVQFENPWVLGKLYGDSYIKDKESYLLYWEQGGEAHWSRFSRSDVAAIDGAEVGETMHGGKKYPFIQVDVLPF